MEILTSLVALAASALGPIELIDLGYYLAIFGGSSRSTTNIHEETNVLTGELVVQGEGNNVVYEYSDADVLKALGADAFDAVGGMTGALEDMHYENSRLANNAFNTSSDMFGMGAGLVSEVNHSNTGFLTGVFRDGTDFLSDSHDTNTSFLGRTHDTNADLMGDWSNNLAQLTSGALQFTENASRDSMRFVSNFTEREQLGAAAGQQKAMTWVAIAAIAAAAMMVMKK